MHAFFEALIEPLLYLLEFLARFEWIRDHWRFAVCALLGLGSAIGIWTAAPAEAMTHVAATAAILVGLWVGILWDRG